MNSFRHLRTFGWEGPYPGGSHMVMMKERRKITIPNPHRGDLDWSLVKQILEQAGIDAEQWKKASQVRRAGEAPSNPRRTCGPQR